MYLDHDFVHIELNLRNVSQQGPIVWKFNNLLLGGEKFCTAVSDLICHYLRFRSSPSDLVMWDCLKHDIKQLSQEKISTINQISFLGCHPVVRMLNPRSTILFDTTV